MYESYVKLQKCYGYLKKNIIKQSDILNEIAYCYSQLSEASYALHNDLNVSMYNTIKAIIETYRELCKELELEISNNLVELYNFLPLEYSSLQYQVSRIQQSSTTLRKTALDAFHNELKNMLNLHYKLNKTSLLKFTECLLKEFSHLTKLLENGSSNLNKI